jgi:hypothetical protein
MNVNASGVMGALVVGLMAVGLWTIGRKAGEWIAEKEDK